MRWRILAILFLARITMAVQFQAVAALSPVIMHAFGVGLAEIGVLIGLYVAPGIAVALPGGAIGSRFGDRNVVAAGMVLMIVGGALMALCTTWEAQIAGRLIAGAGGVVLNVLMSKMVQDWFTGREIATAMAIFVNSWPVGIAAALLLLPPIAEVGGLAVASGSVAALVALGLLLLLAGYRRPTLAGVPPMLRARLRGAPLRGVLLGGAIWALFNAAFGTVFGFGPALLAERGWHLAEASAATSVVMWVVALSAPLGGVLADRTGRRDTMLAIGVLVSAAAMVSVVIAGEAVLPTFVVIGLSFGLAVGPILSLPAEVLAPETRATGMGIFYTLFYAVAVVFPALVGHAADGFKSAAITFLLGAASLVACLPLLAVFRATRARSAVVA